MFFPRFKHIESEIEIWLTILPAKKSQKANKIFFKIWSVKTPKKPPHNLMLLLVQFDTPPNTILPPHTISHRWESTLARLSKLMFLKFKHIFATVMLMKK